MARKYYKTEYERKQAWAKRQKRARRGKRTRQPAGAPLPTDIAAKVGRLLTADEAKALRKAAKSEGIELVWKQVDLNDW